MSKSCPELRPNRYDAMVAALVVLLAVVVAVAYYGALGSGGDVSAVITHRGEEVAVCPLDEDRTLTVGEAYHLTITVSGGEIAVTHSDCPTQDCVRTGAISRAGESIVCLPEQVIVKLTGDTQSGADIVIG